MIKSEYQQPSFTFSTCYADYDVSYENHTVGDEKWVIGINYKNGALGKFQCPIDWSREYIFGWLVRMEIDNI